MKIKQITNIEEKWDYSFDILNEISDDISKLPNYTLTIFYALKKIDAKLNRAKLLWLNITKIEKQFLDFRKVILNRNIDDKIKNLKNNLDIFVLHIENIINEYEYLKQRGLELDDIWKKIEILKAEKQKAKIIYMIKDLKKSYWSSPYSLDMLLSEIELAKKKWIDVENIKNLLLD